MLVRNAQPKPVKGAYALERHAKRQAIKRHEEQEKAAVRQRDRVCRWPACEYKALKPRLEVAHLDDKGMGGDHGARTARERMVLLCWLHHQGPTSLHSGALEIEPLTKRGTDGPVAFYRRAESGRMECVAVERSIGVSETRRWA